MYFLVYNFICCIFEYNQTNKKKDENNKSIKKRNYRIF